MSRPQRKPLPAPKRPRNKFEWRPGDLKIVKRFFSPDQPRAEAGTPEGGQWIDGAGAGGAPYAVDLRRFPEVLTGTGGRGRVTVQDIATHLNNQTLANNGGKPLDPENPADMQKAVDMLTAETRYQQGMEGNGGNFYDSEVNQVFETAGEAIPRLETDADLRTITLAMSGIMSPGADPTASMSAALTAIEEYEKTGILPGRNPYPIEEGKDGWLGRAAGIKEQQIGLLQYLINRDGEAGAAAWLMGTHARSELDQLRRDSGLYSPTSTIAGGGKLADLRYGVEVFGPKVGPFILNQSGIGETTVDLWASRTFNRAYGSSFLPGAVTKTGLTDEPRNDTERAQMKATFRAVADNVKISEQQTQALLWFHEQALYKSLGGRVREATLVDGANKFIGDYRKRAGSAASHALRLIGDEHDARFESSLARAARDRKARARAAKEGSPGDVREFYSPDQLREPAGSPEGGRFAGGGAGNAAIVDAKYRGMTLVEGQHYLKDKYGMTVDFYGVNTKLIGGIVQEVDELKTKYPQVDFHNLVTVPMPDTPRVWADAAGGTIRLNADYWGREDFADLVRGATVDNAAIADMVPPWHDGMDNPSHIIAHEFGHLLDEALSRDQNGAFTPNGFVRVSGMGGIRDTMMLFKAEHYGAFQPVGEKSTFVSSYAGTNNKEWFAETFAATRYGDAKSQANPEVQHMKAFVDIVANPANRTEPYNFLDPGTSAERDATNAFLEPVAKKIGVRSYAMVTGPVPLCWSCSRYHAGALAPHRCDAYPDGDGIPAKILSWQHDHHKVYIGDNGMTYEAGTPQIKTYYNPDQPRDPAGTETGGQWSDGGGGAAGGAADEDHQTVRLEEVMPNAADRERLAALQAEANALPRTNVIDTPERRALREHIVDQLYEQGGVAHPTGGPPEIAHGREAWIVAGLPASGKSEFVEPVIAENKAILIDADEAKALIPEMGNGLGAGAVHEESAAIIVPTLLERAIGNGDNIMMPRVGRNYDEMKADVEALKAAGYKVHMVYIDVPPKVSVERAVARFQHSGRLVSVDYINSLDGKPKGTFERLRAAKVADSYTFIDNAHVPHGTLGKIVYDEKVT